MWRTSRARTEQRQGDVSVSQGTSQMASNLQKLGQTSPPASEAIPLPTP